MTTPVSLTLPQFAASFNDAGVLGRMAADIGLAGLFCFDHLIPLGNVYRPVFEHAAVMGAMAATSTVRVGSLVTRVTLRPPATTAAMARCAYAIAGGQMVLGLGVGDRLSEDELVRNGMALVKLDRRLGLLEETIGEVRRHVPDLPIWVGGRHPGVRQVAAAHADGWNAWHASASELADEADEVRAGAGRPMTISWGGAVLLAADQADLDQAILERGGKDGIIAGTPAQALDTLGGLAAIADEIVLSLVPNRPASWELLASKILPHL
ncbi:MAG: LLM class flavin-dependent oxidoreductase [Actinomycetota bacterium]